MKDAVKMDESQREKYGVGKLEKKLENAEKDSNRLYSLGVNLTNFGLIIQPNKEFPLKNH